MPVELCKSGAGTPRTPKALRAKMKQDIDVFRKALGVRTRPRVALAHSFATQSSAERIGTLWPGSLLS